MKKIISLLLFLFAAATASAQTDKKRLIDTADINYAELVKVNFTGPAKSQKKLLTKAQSADFASRWNTSNYMGADKYKMTYYVYVILKTGTKRQFTVSGSSIQDEDWITYDIGDTSYFDKLWNIK